MDMLTRALACVTAMLIVCVGANAEPFSYQGNLELSGSPANGTFDMRFGLYSSTDNQIGSDITLNDVEVVDGLFTVYLDFGPTAFAGLPGQTLAVSVREGSSNGVFTPLMPRVPIGTVPVAEYALNQEIHRNNLLLTIGESFDTFLLNPELSSGTSVSTLTDLQLNFSGYVGGFYINGQDSGSSQILGFARQNTSIAYMEVRPVLGGDEMSFVVSPGRPLTLRAESVVVDGALLAKFGGSEEQISPVAFGHVNSNGSIGGGSGNFFVDWNSGLQRYEITINDEAYFHTSFTTTVTVSSGTFPRFATTSSVSNKLLVYINDLSGNHTQNAFAFMVYRNEPE